MYKPSDGVNGPEGGGGVPPLIMLAQVTLVEWASNASVAFIVVVVGCLVALAKGRSRVLS